MKAIKIVLDPSMGWHIRKPETYRVERTYPIVPPTTLFGIVQNLLNTSSYKTSYKELIPLGGFPTTNVGLSLEMQRIVKIKNTQNGKEKIVGDRHQIEIAHSGLIDAYLLLPENKVSDYLPDLKKRTGDVFLLTTNQFPVIVRDISCCEVTKTRSKKLLFGLEREGVGLPHILPLSYKFGKSKNYRTHQYFKILLPFMPVISDNLIKRQDIELFEKIDVLSIEGSNFDAELVKYCKNRWDKSIEPSVGTI